MSHLFLTDSLIHFTLFLCLALSLAISALLLILCYVLALQAPDSEKPQRMSVVLNHSKMHETVLMFVSILLLFFSLFLILK